MMEISESSNFRTICRVCLKDFGQMHDLFVEVATGIFLHEIFTSTTNFEVDPNNDGLSTFLCEKCTSIIIDFHNLKMIYEQNSNQNITSITEEDIEKSDSDISETADVETIKVENLTETEEPNPDAIKIDITLQECSERENIEHADYNNHGDEDYDMVNIHTNYRKIHICDVCGSTFRRRYDLWDHKDIHETIKKHVCRYCNKAFQRRTVLVKHTRIHTHPRQCICELCGKAFNDKDTLKTHIILLHVKTRNFPCTICNERFPLKATLQKHIKRHENKERQFFCAKCPAGYKDRSSLERHVASKHNEDQPKFSCHVCGKQYTSTGNLSRHKRCCHLQNKIIETQ